MLERLPLSRLLDHHGGRHFASEPHIRIQVQPVPVRSGDGEPFFKSYHGELLIHCIQGSCMVETARESCELAQGDQILLTDAEPFRIERAGDQEGVVQLVWAPGMNPCLTCWERDDKFFRPSQS